MNVEFTFDQFRQFAGDHKGWLFRGQSNPIWPLEASYWRFSSDGAIEKFRVMLITFIKRASRHLGKNLFSLSIPEQIAVAQHYGLPTPFLDWTDSPYIALFFALIGRVRTHQSDSVAVWALEPRRISVLSESEKLCLDEPSERPLLIILESYETKRLARQMGKFTFLPKPNIFCEGTSSIVNKILVNVQNPDACLAELRLMGITAGNLMDDLDGVAVDTMLEHP